MKPIVFLFICLWVNAALSQPAQKLPPHTRVVFFGDSHTSYGYGVKDNSVQYQNHGYVAWVNTFAPGIQIPKGGILGVPGETTVQMVKRLQPITTSNAGILVVLAGTNDVLMGVNTETIKANLRTIYNTGLAAGMKVIAITILQQYNPPAYHQTVDDFRKNVNAWIRSQSDITVIDTDTDLKAQSFYDDGIHLTPAGSQILGKKVAAVINSWVTECLPGSANAAELSVAANTNPLLAGTGGTKPSAAGVVATNWELSGSSAGGATITGSKENSDGGPERQVITVSGTYTGSSRRVMLTNIAATPISLQAGDVVEGVAEVEIPSNIQGIKAMYLKITANSQDYKQLLGEGNSMFHTINSPVYFEPGKYLLRTPAITIGTGSAVGHLFTQVVLELKDVAASAPVAATLKISSVGIRRLPLLYGPLVSIAPAEEQTVCPDNPLLLQANPTSGYNYQWIANGTELTGKTTTTLSVAQPGEYRVKLMSLGCAVLSQPVTVIPDCSCAQPYRFTGNGAWSNPANWQNGRIPPSTLTTCDQILIDPVQGGECVVNAAIYLSSGANLRVLNGKTLRVL